MRKEDFKKTAALLVGTAGTGKHVIVQDASTGLSQRINVPTSDPSAKGALYFDGSVLKISTASF